MRKLKLQIHISLDGYIAGPNGELDWITRLTDDSLTNRIYQLVDSSDTILLGRKMTDEFVNYWTSVLDSPESPEYSFAQKLVNTPKIVFSKTIEESSWANTTLANGDLTEEIEKLKNKDGKDLLVYGGANFVSNLVKNNLIDEYHFLVEPVAIGKGLTIFGDSEERLKLELVNSEAFSCGVTFSSYKSQKN